MTSKRNTKRKSKERERPTVEKEKLKDLSADSVADKVKGGQLLGTGGCARREAE
jgi:hypothetical protein